MGAFRVLRSALAGVLVAVAGFVHAGAIGPAALRAYHTTIAPQLARNAFGAPLLLQSEEATRRVEGEVYAVLDHPFDKVSHALADPAQWCDILILHLNTKLCRRVDSAQGVHIDIYVGKKEPQRPQDATQLSFAWRPPVQRPGYLLAQLEADEGPYSTHDYLISVEAMPLDEVHTFVHMGYAFSYGGASSIAMKLYLATVARGKVGFTAVRTDSGERLVGGVRGIVERNTMRYYLAIDAYLDSLAAPREQQPEKRMAQWFDSTERYARQLHELDRDEYLKMKREELRRQAAGAAP